MVVGGGAEIASPVVTPEAGEPEVAEISGSDSDGIEEKESDERHDSDSDRRSEASSPGSSTLSWGDGYGGESDDSDLMGGAWSLKGSCAAAGVCMCVREIDRVCVCVCVCSRVLACVCHNGCFPF